MLKKVFIISVIALGLTISASASTNTLVKAKLETGFVLTLNSSMNVADSTQQIVVSFNKDTIECSATGRASLTSSHRAEVYLDGAKCGDEFYNLKSSFYDNEMISGAKNDIFKLKKENDSIFLFSPQDGYISLFYCFRALV